MELKNEFSSKNESNLEDEPKGSHKKVWWKCSVNQGHEWQASLYSRFYRKSGCPYCSGRLATKENNLSLHSVSKEFHPTKNGNKTPEDFTLKSGKKIWWKCSKNPDHEWEAIIASRTKNTNGCPFCAGRKSSKNNNLSLHPIAKEFHYERNSPLTSEELTLHSSKKVWWRCDKGHEWEALVRDRTRNDGKESFCPHCINYGYSKKEIEVLNFVNSLNVDCIHRYKLYGVEADIFIPDSKLAIEFNGLYWHSEIFKGKDYHYDKFNHFLKNGIQLFHLWEDEWRDKQEEMKETIKNLIELNSTIRDKMKLTSEWTDFKNRYSDYAPGRVRIWGPGSWEIKCEL